MKLPFTIHNQAKTNLPWLVFINGLFASRESWGGGIEQLKDHFRILLYDGRGQGSGPRPPGPYTLYEQVDDLEELLADLSIESCLLVGISNGARIALEFSRRHPKVVKALVAADTYINVTPLLKAKLTSWKEANRIGGPFFRFDMATPWIWGETTVANNGQMISSWREKADETPNYVIEALLDGAMENIHINLSEINSDILILVGEEDLLTPPFLHQKMHEELQKGELQFIPGGHASLLEYPESINEKVLPFLLEHV